MPRPSAIKVATIEANMALISRAKERQKGMASLRQSTANLYHRLGVMLAEEDHFIEQCLAENEALKAGRRVQVAA